MDDGVPDTWNLKDDPTSKAKSGVTSIEFRADAHNDWFGDEYGTVTVRCTSGLGRSFTLNSTDMPNAPKAKVFFDPNKAVDGTAPAAGKPPAWFVFWQQGPVPDLAGFRYDHNYTGYGRSDSNGDLMVGPPAGGTHYPGGYVINGITFGGSHVTGIDCAAEVAAHERAHVALFEQLDAGAVDSDNDRLPDNFEATYSTVIGNPDTHNVAGIRGNPNYANYGDNEYAVMVIANGKTGIASQDWSKGGKQW